MIRYLYRISTKKADVWSDKKPKPVYIVARSKEAAAEWASNSLKNGLVVAKITRLAEQVGGEVFLGL